MNLTIVDIFTHATEMQWETFFVNSASLYENNYLWFSFCWVTTVPRFALPEETSSAFGSSWLEGKWISTFSRNQLLEIEMLMKFLCQLFPQISLKKLCQTIEEIFNGAMERAKRPQHLLSAHGIYYCSFHFLQCLQYNNVFTHWDLVTHIHQWIGSFNW